MLRLCFGDPRPRWRSCGYDGLVNIKLIPSRGGITEKVHLSKDLKKRGSSHADNCEGRIPSRGDNGKGKGPTVWLE